MSDYIGMIHGKGKATFIIYKRFVFKATSLWGRVYEPNTKQT